MSFLKKFLTVVAALGLALGSSVFARGGGGGQSPSGFDHGSPAGPSAVPSQSNGRFADDRQVGLERAEAVANSRADAGLRKAEGAVDSSSIETRRQSEEKRNKD